MMFCTCISEFSFTVCTFFSLMIVDISTQIFRFWINQQFCQTRSLILFWIFSKDTMELILLRYPYFSISTHAYTHLSYTRHWISLKISPSLNSKYDFQISICYYWRQSFNCLYQDVIRSPYSSSPITITEYYPCFLSALKL